MKGEKERGKNCILKNTAVVWDRARYLIVCRNILATSNEVIVDPFNQPIWGITMNFTYYSTHRTSTIGLAHGHGLILGQNLAEIQS